MTNEPSLYSAIQAIANNDPDFVRDRNEIGFNAYDCAFGHLLAETPPDLWTPRQKYQAWSMLRKYRRQLADVGIEYDAIPVPTSIATKLVDYRDGAFRVIFDYNADLVTAIKAVPSAHFSRYPIVAWYVRPSRQAVEALLDFAPRNQFVCTPEAEEAMQEILLEPDEPVAEVKPPLPTRRVEWQDGTFRLVFPYDPALVNEVRQFPSRKFDKENKVWILPATLETVKALTVFAAKYEFIITPEAQDACKQVAQEHVQAVEASRAEDADLNIAGLGGTLRPFQKAAVKYALAKKRTYLAEEMGLGKTVEALAVIQAANAYPAVVICPASLKLNWQREARKWLPGKRVEVLNGKSNGDWQKADVVVLNYDILGKWLEPLKAHGFKAIVLDECHYIKNHKAQRTDHATELAKGIEYRLWLTGTPVLNRPKELLAQLQALGRLNDLGGFWTFAKRYCDGYQDRFGWNLDGAAHLDELNEKLRATCYVRHEKSKVLKELPPKTRTTIPLPIDNRPEYEDAEADVVAFVSQLAVEDKAFRESIAHLSKEEQKEAIHRREQDVALKARRAEQLVRIEALKQCAARGKQAAIKDWVDSFLESGEKLVVFGWHQAVVNSLAKEYNAPVITGQTPIAERQVNVDKFQNDKACRLIVCNIQAGGLGLTLTAASNAAFVEFGWNPGTMAQAEDRIHRIGQEDAVNIWNLAAADTIDEEILALIDRKATVVDAATEGQKVEEINVIDELVSRLAKAKGK